MEIEKLVKALDNENNSKIMNLTTKKLHAMKMEILKELELSKEELTNYMNKLKHYRYIDELGDLDVGHFIRWINITDPSNLYLSNGATICDIKITDNGIVIVYKNFANKHYQLKMDENLIFQKLTGQEEILLSALDHISS